MGEPTRALLVAALAACAGCAPTMGDGVALTETRVVDEPFDGVRVSGGLVVEITLALDNVGQVEVTSDSNLVPLVGTEVVEGVLVISADNIAPVVATSIRVRMQTLASASAAGEGSAIVAPLVERTGSGELGAIAVGLSEGASGDLSGTCTRLVAVVTGGALLRARDLVCGHGEIEVMEGASVDAHLSESVVVRGSGGSTVRITGAPSDVRQQLSNDTSLTVE